MRIDYFPTEHVLRFQAETERDEQQLERVIKQLEKEGQAINGEPDECGQQVLRLPTLGRIRNLEGGGTVENCNTPMSAFDEVHEFFTPPPWQGEFRFLKRDSEM